MAACGLTIPSQQHLPHTNTVFYAGILPIIRDSLITMALVERNRLWLFDACFEDALLKAQFDGPAFEFLQDVAGVAVAAAFGSDKHPLDFHFGRRILLQGATGHCLPLEVPHQDMLNVVTFVELGIKCMVRAVTHRQFGIEQWNQQAVIRMLRISAEKGDHGILDFECQR